MSNILVAFITGLTTGGLSCLAVQGGLLTSSLATQLERDLQARAILSNSGKGRTQAGYAPRSQAAMPIVLFLGAKLVAYTVLGFFLGSLGSLVQLNATTRAILLIGIGIFMIGNALRMLNVHPIFRYFVFEPPSSLTRYIRRKAKNSTAYFTPLFLGALTVLIPCGVTQAMMAVAMGTANPLQGAAILFAFVLGTSPVFFALAYLALQIGARVEKWFMRFVAVVLLILGFVSVDSGLTLIGSPWSMRSLTHSLFQTDTVPAMASDTLTIHARNDGYSPTVLHAKANEPILLSLVTKNTNSCSRAFVIPALRIEKILPATGTVEVDIPPQVAGSTLRFTCSMGMYSGRIVFDP